MLEEGNTIRTHNMFSNNKEREPKKVVPSTGRVRALSISLHHHRLRLKQHVLSNIG
jgi:hypothetical protein